MRQRGVRGPSAFLVTFGIAVALLGALVFLAIPAANKMDAKESAHTGNPPIQKRAPRVARNATIGLAAGMGFIIWGLALRKSQR